MKNKKRIVYFFIIIGTTLGFLSVLQLEVKSRFGFYNSPQSTNILAREVMTLAKSNQQYEQSLAELDKTIISYESNLNDSNEVEKNIIAETEKLNIINGDLPVNGPGVSITMDGGFTTPDLVDLLNAIHNIGYESLSINNYRYYLGLGFYVDSRKIVYGKYKLDKPLSIKVLGDAEVLEKSLNRSGGIIEQLKSNTDIKISVNTESEINIPSIEK